MIQTTNKPAVRIDYERCHSCDKCLAREVCKVRAIVHFDESDPPFVDRYRCYGCMICVNECPFQAVVPAP